MVTRYQKAKAHARRAYHKAKPHAKGIKPVAIGVVAGAAAAFAQGYLVQNVEFFKTNWYAAPLAMSVASFFVAKKNEGAGMAMAGAAGALGYIGYVYSRGQTPVAPRSVQGYEMSGTEYPQMDTGDMAMDDGETSEIIEEYALPVNPNPPFTERKTHGL